jgi:hypothetical protein
MSRARKLLIAVGWWMGLSAIWVVASSFLPLSVPAAIACGVFVGFLGASIGMAKAGFI